MKSFVGNIILKAVSFVKFCHAVGVGFGEHAFVKYGEVGRHDFF